MDRIRVYKGTSENDKKDYYDLPQNEKLNKVRTRLERDNFITDDHRFVLYQSESTTFEDAVVGQSVEKVIPLSEAIGPAGQLYLTNIKTEKKPDLLGIGTDWFFNNHMGVTIFLNETDEDAKRQNSGKFKPYMLTNVKATSQNVLAAYEHVFVCEENSVVIFDFSSWGAAGYGFSVKSEKQTIADSLYLTYDDRKYDKYARGGIRRFADESKATIVIQGTESLGIPNLDIVRYQKVTFRTWRVTSFKSNGQTYTSNTQPPILGQKNTFDKTSGNHSALANATTNQLIVIPGDSIVPGTPSPGQQSQQEFGSVEIIQEDPKTRPLGELDVYFFVFKDRQAAEKVIQGINAPDPNLWSD